MSIFNAKAEKLLSEVRLKKTPTRIAVLARFLEVEHAQSYFDLQKNFAKKYDKSTLYRTLSSFEEAGLLHHIEDATGVAKYALNSPEQKVDDHAHFVCDNCHNTYCLNEIEEPKVTIPGGFQPKHVTTLINGICPHC